MQADQIGLTEHNLNTKKFPVCKCCHDARTQILSHSSLLTMASSQIEMTNQYKPGSTLTLSQGKISLRLLKAGQIDLPEIFRQEQSQHHYYNSISSLRQISHSMWMIHGGSITRKFTEATW
jgi:hypothetical protein